MYCKFCGQELEESSRFCSSCGKSIIDTPTKEETLFKVSDTNQNQQLNTLDESISKNETENIATKKENFFKLSNTYYCTNCGSNMGKSKTCPNCRHKKNNGIFNFCYYCGSIIENEQCTKSNVIIKNPLIEKILRIVCIAVIYFSFIGVFVNITSGDFLSAVIIFSISLFSNLFIVSKRQIYKIKEFLISKNIKQLWICLAYILVIVFVILGIKITTLTSNTLTGDDLAAYDLIYEVSYEFKNPSSVRVVSGTVIYDEEDAHYSGWFALSATNGFGARTVGYYFVGYLDGEIFALDLEENDLSGSISYAKTRDELDIEKINKALDEKWGTSYD